MCRWLVFVANCEEDSELIADLILRSENGLVHQSYDASYHPEFTAQNNAKLNADGFGFGWYSSNRAECPLPAVFKSQKPMWADSNAREIASVVVFGHVRAASHGSVVSEENCHPFKYERLLFLHNGHIEQFADLKQDLLSRLSKAALLNIKGVTDTEHLFALVLSQLKNPDALSFTLEELSGALIGAYQILMGLLSKHGILGGFTTLNCSLTDGVNCVVTRFCDKPETVAPPSLYFTVDNGGGFSKALKESAQRSGVAEPGDGTKNKAGGSGSGSGNNSNSDSLGPAQKKPKLGRSISTVEEYTATGPSVGDRTVLCVVSEPLTYIGTWHPIGVNEMIAYERGKQLLKVQLDTKAMQASGEAQVK